MTGTEATASQHGIWYTERAGAAGTAYHMALSIRFDGALDETALAAACDAVVARHEPLRTTLVESDSGELRMVPGAAPRLRRAERPIPGEVLARFDLERGPLARFLLATEAPSRHLLLFVAHHLVFDGMSKDILVRDLAAAYAGATSPPLTGGFAQYAEADRRRVAAALPAAREFWRPRWREPAEPVLPGLSRTPTAAEPGLVVEGTLDGQTVDRTARALGVTRFELLLAAVQVLLRRYGDPAPAVAVDLSTRPDGFGDHIGLFVNELPVAAPVVTGPVTFREYARAVRAELREVYRFRAVPLSHAVGTGRPRAAITPVSVSYRRRGGEEVSFPGLSARVGWMVFHHAARNALHLQFVDHGASIDFGLQHSPAAIGTGAVRRIAGHLGTLLASAAADPDRDVAALALLAPQERAEVVRTGPVREYPPELTLVSGFAAQVRSAPAAVAVVAGARQVSYRELDEAAGRLAAGLRRRGVGPGDRVGICLGRSVQLLVAVLAVARTGAAWLPVDPTHPERRRAAVFADAGVKLVLDRDSGVAGGSDEYEQGVPPARSDLAYVIYTSGSTGWPKGVAVSHGALANLLQAMAGVLDSGPADRWLAVASLSFDMSVPELFLPLLVGARTVIVPDDAVRDGAAQLRLIREQGITHLQATPSGWRMLLDAGFGAAGREPVVALAGAEALPLPLARELRGRVPRLFNLYGPTEATVWATTAELPDPVEQVTIGRPLPNLRAYVLDDRGEPVPTGVTGELCLAGVQLADGYLGQPELTGQRFRPGPDGERIYRTGDLVRLGFDGQIVYLGRVDDQVKLRGHRIELGEVETRLLECPGVRQAAAALRGEAEDARLVGYLVGTPPDPAGLREHLAGTLPAIMIPTDWVVLDRLPLTRNGKLDRAALPGLAPRPAAAGPAAEADEVAGQVRDIWQEILKIDDIGLDEDLFDLGGHSLTVTRIIARIHQRLGVTVPLEVFYDTPTIAEVADTIRGITADR